MKENNAVWMWSETFVESVERSLGDPPSDEAELRDWSKYCDRLRRWWHEVEEARKEYQEERPWHLRDLYNFWRNVGLEDIQEQAMLARGCYPRFRSWGWRPVPLCVGLTTQAEFDTRKHGPNYKAQPVSPRAVPLCLKPRLVTQTPESDLSFEEPEIRRYLTVVKDSSSMMPTSLRKRAPTT